jgi:hypothetical protein
VHGLADPSGEPRDGQFVEPALVNERPFGDLAVCEPDGGQLVSGQTAAIEDERRCCVKPSRDLDAADFPPRC